MFFLSENRLLPKLSSQAYTEVMTNHPFIKAFLSVFAGTAAVIIALLIAGGIYDFTTTQSCNVAHYSLTGELTTTELDGIYQTDSGLLDQTSSTRLVRWIGEANDDDSMDAILLDVDSYGGLPVAGEEIANALKT